MNLSEHQAKELLGRYGVPIPRGEVAGNPDAARKAAQTLGGRVVVKAQVPTGGRGKAGGIRLADSPEGAARTAAAILGTKIKGYLVRDILVEEAVEIRRELYLGLTLERDSRRLVMMACAEGGMEIEELARNSPEKIRKVVLDPFLGLHGFQARALAYGLGFPGDEVRDFGRIAQAMAKLAKECDATLVEINPLAQTSKGLIALDAKVILDDSALFRQKAFAALQSEENLSMAEAEARKRGLSYVELPGDIGCLVNGAGLAMATMDALALYGGAPANFLDIGGGARAEMVDGALRLLLQEERVQVALVNIFGGITRGDEVARGLLTSLQNLKPTVPIVVRLAGTNAQEGLKMLAGSGVQTAPSLEEAAKLAVELAKRRRDHA